MGGPWMASVKGNRKESVISKKTTLPPAPGLTVQPHWPQTILLLLPCPQQCPEERGLPEQTPFLVLLPHKHFQSFQTAPGRGLGWCFSPRNAWKGMVRGLLLELSRRAQIAKSCHPLLGGLSKRKEGGLKGLSWGTEWPLLDTPRGPEPHSCPKKH